MKNKLIFILIAAIFISSCEEETNVTYEPDIIVESYLHEGETIEVYLGQEIPFKQDKYELIDFNEASVIVKNDSNNIILEYQGDGKFVGDTLFLPMAEVIYTLEIYWNNKIITAETIVPIKPSNFTISTTSIEVDNSGTGGLPNMSEAVDLTWDNPDGDYYLLKIENIETNPEEIFDEERPSMQNKTFQEEGAEIRPMDFKYYGTHQIILYHINNELAAIYDEHVNSSQNLTDPTTNIINGYGIFTGINSDTLFLEVTD